MDSKERFDDQQATLQSAMRGSQAGLWTALPGIITDVSQLGPRGTVTVQPAIQGVVSTPEQVRSYVSMPLLPDVPVIFPRGGGYTLTFPIAVGDECLCVFSSRCIDNWWAQGGVQPPFEQRMHDLSDAFALVGPFSQKTWLGGIAGGAQLRSNDGTMSVTLDGAGGIVTIKAPTRIVLDAPSVTVPNGGLVVKNDISTTHGSILDGTINLSTHVHLEMGDGNNTGPAKAP